jgi:hypothetical protein
MGPVRGVRRCRRQAGRIVGVGGEIPAPHVVDETVAVVIDRVAGDLVGIRPHVRLQVGVAPIGSAVDDRHHDVALLALRTIPALGEVHAVHVGFLSAPARVVRLDVDRIDPLRLGVLDTVHARQFRRHRFWRRPVGVVREVDALERHRRAGLVRRAAFGAQRLQALQPMPRQDPIQRRHTGLERAGRQPLAQRGTTRPGNALAFAGHAS